MTDIVDRQTRSRMMAGIKGKNTKPELALRRALHARGFRYRLHSKNVRGRPDLVLSKHRAVIFVHGCFWHRHLGWRYATTPATRVAFWQAVRRKRCARQRRSGRAACGGLARHDDLAVCPSKGGKGRGNGRTAFNMVALRNGDARARRTRGLATYKRRPRCQLVQMIGSTRQGTMRLLNVRSKCLLAHATGVEVFSPELRQAI